ncbi:MAG TPA: VWA domain-containing protein [Bryobacteraceae bacterium]|jgi:Ca-activated chloride channel family protein|nr:VWA domain-containing protein [Bryobacteraceae bacterium]
MLPWFKAASAALALTAVLGAQIKVNVRLVRVLATVKNPAGELVGALNKDDFEVLDNSVPQQIAVFERQTAQPLSVAMLVDASGSTAKDLKYEVDSVARFFKALFAEGNASDAVALYSFNYQVTLHNFFTHNQAPLEHSLRTIQGEAGTSLYDAIYFASRHLEEREGRKVMVIVTDGGDTTSVKDFHAALDSAQLANASIYPVLVVPIENDAGRNLGGEHALTTMALGTGGRVFQPTLGAAMDAAFSDIIKELRTQYLLAYYPKDVPLTKNRFHRLLVRVRRPDLRVTARNGYYGEAEQESQLRQDQAENPGIALPNKPLKR